MKRKIILLLSFYLLLNPNLSLAEFDHNSKEFRSVVSQLDMQGHADHELSTCTMKQVYYEEVLEMLNEDGMNEEEIIQSYVDEYGQAALREPATDKSGLIAWGMPVFGLVAGIAIVFIWLKKLKGNTKKENQQNEKMWESETEREIAEKLFDEERRKLF